MPQCITISKFNLISRKQKKTWIFFHNHLSKLEIEISNLFQKLFLFSWKCKSTYLQTQIRYTLVAFVSGSGSHEYLWLRFDENPKGILIYQIHYKIFFFSFFCRVKLEWAFQQIKANISRKLLATFLTTNPALWIHETRKTNSTFYAMEISGCKTWSSVMEVVWKANLMLWTFVLMICTTPDMLHVPLTFTIYCTTPLMQIYEGIILLIFWPCITTILRRYIQSLPKVCVSGITVMKVEKNSR